MLKLKPLSDYVIIEPATREERTRSGIVLPDTVDKEEPQQGTVIAVGLGRHTENGIKMQMSVKKGDKVLFKKYGPDKIKVGDEEYLIAKEEDILAIIE